MSKQEVLCLKQLDLVTADYARWRGLEVDRPVFISPWDSKPLVYEVGAVIQAPNFEPIAQPVETIHRISEDVGSIEEHPRYGIGYFSKMPNQQMHRWTASNTGTVYWGELNMDNWMAVVESMGTVVRYDSEYSIFNRLTDRLRVKEIMVSCRGCHVGPLTEGMLLEPYSNGLLYAWCYSDSHEQKLASDVPGTLADLLARRHYFFAIEPNLAIALYKRLPR